MPLRHLFRRTLTQPIPRRDCVDFLASLMWRAATLHVFQKASASGTFIHPDHNTSHPWRRPVASVFAGLRGVLCVIWEPHSHSATTRRRRCRHPHAFLAPVPVPAWSRRRYTMSSCGSVRCGRETSGCAAPAKSPCHMVLFMHGLFHIPAMCKKKKKKIGPRNTQTVSKWQQRKCNYRKHIHHQPCPEPTVAFRCVQTGTEGLSVRASRPTTSGALRPNLEVFLVCQPSSATLTSTCAWPE